MKLEILLCLVALMQLPLGGELNIHMNALLHGTASISYSPLEKLGTIKSITWRLDKNGSRVTIVDNSEKPYFIYGSQFKDRLQMSDNLFTLTVINLTMEDNGIYTIDVADVDGSTGHKSFNVTIYEPVPVLHTVRTEVKENTADRCNVTLHCSVPSKTSDFTYTWKSRQSKSDYVLYNNGSTIQLSLGKESRDTEFLCIIQNPVEEKNISAQLQKICMFSEKMSVSRSHVATIIAMLIAVVMLLVAVSIIYIFFRKKDKEKKEQRESRHPEMHYIEVTTHQPEDNQIIQMENEHYIVTPSARKTKAETVYTTLQHPQPKYR